jgi:hypothetical protein
MTRYAYDTDAKRSGRVARTPQEESEYEYASDHEGAGGEQESHLETGVLYQPLVSEPPSDEGTTGVVPLCEDTTHAGCTQNTGGVGHRVGRRLVRALNHDYPERGLSGCAKGLIAYGALGVATDFTDPLKAIAACIIGEALG